MHIAFVLLLLLTLLKYLWLAGYAHPVADDYCYAAKSAGQTLWQWSKGEWLYWNGRYTSNLLMIHGPVTWAGDLLIGYRLIPVLLIAATYLSAWFLMRRINRHALSTQQELLATLCFLLLYLQLMPDLGEGFYWYTGAITYQLGSILLLLHVGLLIAPTSNRVARGMLFLLNMVLAIAIVGMDEIHMVLMLCLHLGRMAWLIGTRKQAWGAALLLLAVLGGSLVMYLAPGNAVRGAMFADTHRLWWSLGMSALQSVRFIGMWLFSPSLLIFGVLYIPLHREMRGRIPGYQALLRTPPWIAGLLPFLLVVATTFPAYWNTGLLGQHRTINVACIFFIPLAFLNLALWLERGARGPMGAGVPSMPMAGWAMALALLALNLTGNGFAANADLLGGRAEAYDQVMSAREAQMRAAADDPGTKVIFIPQEKPPRTLPSYEGASPLRDWMMHCQARFFGADEGQVELQEP